MKRQPGCRQQHWHAEKAKQEQLAEQARLKAERDSITKAEEKAKLARSRLSTTEDARLAENCKEGKRKICK